MDDEYVRDCSDDSSPRSLTDFCSTPVTGETQKSLNHSELNQTNVMFKRRVSRIAGGGLREYSLKVCNKVESKGITAYSEVADEIVMEFSAAQSNSLVSLKENDVKNIRRRVYDALNVLLALDIIKKVKKEIQWKGLPSLNEDLEEIKVVRSKLVSSIQKKAAYVKDLEDQLADLDSLILRNQELHKSGSVPQGFSLPLMIVQTRPQATVEIEISEDTRVVHFDFKRTPFSLHDDAGVLRLMRHSQLL